MTFLQLVVCCVVGVWIAIIAQQWLRRFWSGTGGSAFGFNKHFSNNVDLGPWAGCHSVQGARSHMEDTYSGLAAIRGDSRQSFFAVMDGHGGSMASKFAAETLHEELLQQQFEEYPFRSLIEAFRAVDRGWLQMAQRKNRDDGSTVVASLLLDDMLYVANLGDSRAVLSCHGRAIPMSSDHKPNREDERRRIEALGGRVIHYGTWRVEGVLAVSRAIGDRRLKKFVTPEAEIRERRLESGDEFLILASDGLWDVISSQSACDAARQLMSGGASPAEISRILVEKALELGSMDNVTCLVVDLRSRRKHLAHLDD